MKNSFPKKSFSSFGKGSARKTSDRPFKKGSSSSRPYEPNTHYGSNKKSSSYRGKNFREESVERGMNKPEHASQETSRVYPTTRASVPSSSPKSVYVKAARTERGERTERTSIRTGSRNSVLPVARKTAPSKPKDTVSKKLPATSHKSPAASSDTSWGGVASWYDTHLEKAGDTYHEMVVYPNLMRIVGDIKSKRVLDLACGQGQFSRLMRDQGAYVTGVDLGKELIEIAESNNKSIKETGTHKVTYFTGSADDLYMLKDASFDTVVCVLALQNIENLQKTIEEAKRVLVSGGSFIFVLNHPVFRNPRHTHWGYDESQNVQFRRIDQYMSESHVKIDMTPGSKTKKKFTVSFHRPLQVYVKALAKQGLLVSRLEEWGSHRSSEKGPRKHAEDISRKEIPLFMCIEAQKI